MVDGKTKTTILEKQRGGKRWTVGGKIRNHYSFVLMVSLSNHRRTERNPQEKKGGGRWKVDGKTQF